MTSFRRRRWRPGSTMLPGRPSPNISAFCGRPNWSSSAATGHAGSTGPTRPRWSDSANFSMSTGPEVCNNCNPWPNRPNERKETLMAELTREVVMDASPATIFPFLTDPSQHVRWMGTEAELDPRAGGVYRVLAQGKHPGVGEFVEVVSDRKVVFTFGWDEPDHPIPARSTEVEITLTPDGDKTRVRLIHRSEERRVGKECRSRWSPYH